MRGLLSIQIGICFLRKYLDLAVNIRPANNIVILRENTQDIYTNEEYGYGDVFFSKKLLTKNVTERFAQFCKTFISNNNYSNATIMCKDNLLSDKYFIDILNKYIIECFLIITFKFMHPTPHKCKYIYIFIY